MDLNFINLHQLGAISLVFSAGILSYGLLTTFLAMPTRGHFLIFQSSLIFALDSSRRLFQSNAVKKKTKKKKKTSNLQSIWLRFSLGIVRPLQKLMLQIFNFQDRRQFISLAYFSFYAQLIVTTAAVAILLILLAQNTLLNRYVVSNSTAELSIFYRLSALWAGSAGSLLLWYWLLSVFSFIAVRQAVKRYPQRLWGLMFILICAQMIFAALLLFAEGAQPFRVYPQEMLSGRGINPLLLHWAMIIHPPILYLGYISTLIPFAILMSGILTNDTSNYIEDIVRKWILFSWFFLGFGILLGSKWAYEELGWGGYWAWDPVENSSLMPWLIGTALVHSLIVRQRCRQLSLWTLVLAILFYHFSLLGTWITRSGILEGPHTFAESSIGAPLITYTLISLFFYSGLLFFNRGKVRAKKPVEYITSKEGSMLLNNILMVFMVAIILLGIFSPLLPIECGFSEGTFSCQATEWKQSAYNRILIPIAVFTLFLMGASPLLTWKKKGSKFWWKTYRWPLAVGALFFFSYLFFYLFLSSSWLHAQDYGEPLWRYSELSLAMGALTLAVAGFAVAGIAQEYYYGIRSRMIRFQENPLLAWLKLLARNKQRYVGYLFHISIIFLFIGYSGGIFKKTSKVSFLYSLVDSPNEEEVLYISRDRAYVDSYQISARYLKFKPQFRSPSATETRNFIISQSANYELQSQNQNYSITTERHFFPQVDVVSARVIRDQQLQAIQTATSEPDIVSFLREDVYLQLGAIYDPTTQGTNLNHLYESYYFIFDREATSRDSLFPPFLIADLQIWINPLVQFIWIGSLIFFFAGIFILIPWGEPRYKKKSKIS